MPYIIQVPGIPRPYITNDPRIYMDCARIFNWPCEARPFSDSYCRRLRATEDSRHEAERRREQLESYWLSSLGHYCLLEAAAIPLPDPDDDGDDVDDLDVPPLPPACTFVTAKHAKHAKHDSVHQDDIQMTELAKEEEEEEEEERHERQNSVWDRTSRQFGISSTFDGLDHDAPKQGMIGPMSILRRWALQTDRHFPSGSSSQ